jgi:hypothetical protein
VCSRDVPRGADVHAGREHGDRGRVPERVERRVEAVLVAEVFEPFCGVCGWHPRMSVSTTWRVPSIRSCSAWRIRRTRGEPPSADRARGSSASSYVSDLDTMAGVAEEIRDAAGEMIKALRQMRAVSGVRSAAEGPHGRERNAEDVRNAPEACRSLDDSSPCSAA